MLKKLLAGLFPKKPVPAPEQDKYIVAQLNDKIMPIDRGYIYEDPLDEFLKIKYYGEVSGGGTLQEVTGEIKYCDVEIKVKGVLDKQAINEIVEKLEGFGAPKGSKLIIEETGEEIPFGRLEGMAIYLDGVNLSDEVYKNSDTEALSDEIKRLTGIKNDITRYWQGNTETAIYFYSDSFEGMKNATAEFIKITPDCESSRVVQIA